MVFISKEKLHVSAYSGHLWVITIHLTIQFERITGMAHLRIYWVYCRTVPYKYTNKVLTYAATPPLC